MFESVEQGDLLESFCETSGISPAEFLNLLHKWLAYPHEDMEPFITLPPLRFCMTFSCCFRLVQISGLPSVVRGLLASTSPNDHDHDPREKPAGGLQHLASH